MFESTRLEDMRSVGLHNEVLERFNAAIDDYNTICSQYRYRAADRSAVEVELLVRYTALRNQALDRLNSWRNAARTTSTPAPQWSAPTTMPAQAPLAPPLPTTPPVEIDLLDIEQAQRVQRRLADLGFFKGPLSGTWGPASRAAMPLLQSSEWHRRH